MAYRQVDALLFFNAAHETLDRAQSHEGNRRGALLLRVSRLAAVRPGSPCLL
jgi:hypothetical protein